MLLSEVFNRQQRQVNQPVTKCYFFFADPYEPHCMTCITLALRAGICFNKLELFLIKFSTALKCDSFLLDGRQEGRICFVIYLPYVNLSITIFLSRWFFHLINEFIVQLSVPLGNQLQQVLKKHSDSRHRTSPGIEMEFHD